MVWFLPLLGLRLALPADPWPPLADKILSRGDFVSAGERIPAHYVLSAERGDPRGDHHAEYADIWGFVGEEGKFTPRFMTFVSEDWKLTGLGQWEIRQWLWQAGLDGSIAMASRKFLRERAADGLILEMRDEPFPADDPQGGRRLKDLVRFWLKD